MQKIKEIIYRYRSFAFILIVFAVLLIGGCLIYTASKPKPNRPINQSVESVERGIDNARTGITNAQIKIESARDELKRASETGSRLAGKIETDRATLDECERIVDNCAKRVERIQSIVNDIEKSNQGTGTSEESN